MKYNTVCVFGVGGVGGYFGGRMAYAIAQNPNDARRIYFIARGEHLTAIQRDGLRLNTAERQDMLCKPMLATDRVEEIPTPDLYLVCVKAYALKDAIQAISRNITAHTVILPLLNGVDIYERIVRILDTGIVLPACVYVGTHIAQPGVVTQKGGDGVILCGKDPRFPAFDPQGLLDLFTDYRIQFTWQADPYPAIWQKYIFIAAFGLVTASTGKTLGAVMADPETKDLVSKIMAEIVDIAGKKGIALPADVIEISLQKAQNFPPETKTSYQRDVEIPGKPNEGDLFGGTIVRLGQALGVPTPVTQKIYSTIKQET